MTVLAWVISDRSLVKFRRLGRWYGLLPPLIGIEVPS